MKLLKTKLTVLPASCLNGMIAGTGTAFAQSKAIKGSVVDVLGEPVIGASAMAVGNSGIGAVTGTASTISSRSRL